eukprot:3613489-Rhodomonas_salina.1
MKIGHTTQLCSTAYRGWTLLILFRGGSDPAPPSPLRRAGFRERRPNFTAESVPGDFICTVQEQVSD